MTCLPYRSALRRPATLLILVPAMATGAESPALPRPLLTADTSDGVTRVWVESVLPDGRDRRHLLRETAAAIGTT